MIKLAQADFEDGFSCVSIDTDCGKFSGVANVHPEDADIQSSFIGCEIAEYRATIAYFKEKLKRLKQKQELKKEYKKNIQSLKDIIKNKVENRIIIVNKIKEKSNKEEK